MQVIIPLLLGILFIVLKLTGVIAWSWLWVLAPFWIGIAVVLVMLALGVVGVFAAAAAIAALASRK